ncbi:RND transporter [Terrimonas sp.]|uniref:TolC family protein n=1 Tax=Terrimonas sp. TaxID=1914338 RepID=UPI000D5067A5|nr:RND transporter [Terrimonas sp.]
MKPVKFILMAGIACTCILYAGCKTPALVQAPEAKTPPANFSNAPDSVNNSGVIKWKTFFSDSHLVSLIDTALKNSQELAITLQEIDIARNEMRAKQGRLLPFIEGGVGAGIDKTGRYTSQGAGDASTDITPGKQVPDWLPDYRFGITASWEADIWKKLRTAKKAAFTRYLSTIEGKNFVITNLIAEIANSYYELLALDNQLQIVRQTIQLQQNALNIVRLQKQAAAATELAVKKFEGEVLGSQSLEYDVLQKIQEKENKLNYLLGRYPQHIDRDTTGILNITPSQVAAGIPSQLLQNRPDIKQAALDLEAAKLDVKVAKSEFYPSFNIVAGLGFQAFNPSYLIKFPESLLFSLAGDLAGPLINKSAIKAEYYSANARQIQAVYNYERTILNAYIEVSTELSNIKNQQQIFELKAKQVDTLTATINISNALFKAARADYLEVLLSQRDALESKMELIETKLRQFNAVTNIYRSLGGGWN